jgi:phosphoribosyl-dephospho-CoA transferase
MDLPVGAASLHLQRHQLVRLFPTAWRDLLASRADLAPVPWLNEWADYGWPLIVRRRLPGETSDVPVGLPLPPSAGKQRITLQVRYEDIAATAPLPTISDVFVSAPPSWRQCLRQLVELAQSYRVRSSVCGSLAWQRLTGLDYLTPDSDLDMVWTVPHRDQIKRFLTELANIEACAPMRLDGELVREDGSSVNWRELHVGASEIAIKTATVVRLDSAAAFFGS